MDIKKVYKEISAIYAMVCIANSKGFLDGHIADEIALAVKDLQEYAYDELNHSYEN